jgi:hypothetical protein
MSRNKPPAVVVTSPFKDGQTLGNNVQFTATAESEKDITAWAVYVDSKLVYLNKIDSTTLKTQGLLAPGKRHIVLKAWNSDGDHGAVQFDLNLVLA